MTPHANTARGPVFVARTPILTRRQEVLGYRLAAGRRKGPQPPVDGDAAVQIAEVLSASGPDGLTQGRAAFIRVTPRDLAGGILQHLPPERVVLELAADIHPDWDVLDACVEARA